MNIRILQFSTIIMIFSLITCSQSEIEYQMKSQRDKCKDGVGSEGKKDVAYVNCSVALPLLADSSLITNRTPQGMNSYNLLLSRCLLAIHKLNQCEDKSSIFP
ncbi:hypothetical protein ND860_17975 [Leptospira levettii]|uniref:hypothetical protein n=1 Tax=Leptospira levettii TaxID=2023178 RepID=UPI00223E753C|nr:hypothetical protein [Leptospira levettii]MCW7498430.1 hypothetical protein [Leptospira levettii]